MEFAAMADEALVQRILALAVDVQQIPAPTFAEAARAAFVRDRLADAGLAVETDAAGNVLARLPGGSGRPILVSAHLDTVFGAEAPLDVRREPGRIHAPGIGDNALAVAALVGLAWALRASGKALPGDLWLAANVGEEGLGNLAGMRAVIDRLGGTIAAAIVLEGMMLGTVVHRGIASRRYAVEARAAGGHSWGDFGAPSAIHALVDVAARLARLDVPRSPKTTFNIGLIEGGTSVNTIAAEARLVLDLRSEAADALDALCASVQAIVAGAPDGARVNVELLGERPGGALPEAHPLVQLALSTLRAVGVEPDCRASSTDANVPLARGIPAVCVGLTWGKNAHRLDESIETEPLAQGFEQLLRLIAGAYGLAAR